ncbi:hypothetical protein J4438_03450 [Candidatus Woesearchaeota archaeon]|nr:hypothetical protein [Candidatus Woesearchaeota archaeon]
MLKLLKKTRVVVLLFFLIVTAIAINPQFETKGVSIKSVEKDSSAYLAGMVSPTQETAPTNYERISMLNGEQVNNIDDYNLILSEVLMNDTVRIQTNKEEYSVQKTTNDLGLTVQNVPSNNLRKGLELQGGTRVLLKPEEKITDTQRDELIQVMQYRLNTYGLSDIQIKKSDDLLGNKYILIEIAGATKQEVSDLIASQGVFEARIDNQTVFSGGQEDITFVCRNDGTCAGIRECVTVTEGEYCKFEFQIRLSAEAAKKHAEITKELEVITNEDGQEYLSKKLDFYLDDKQVDSLNIGADLKGVEATQIVISGPGIGVDQQEAIQDALTQMNKLQTILITGSFPFKLSIERVDTISPAIGSEFTKNAMIAGIISILAVSIIIFIRYKNPRVVGPVLFVSLSEILLTLGFAALVKYNLDLAAIAGIIAAVGTGVNDQIVITDEILAKQVGEYNYNWKQKIKKAFSIIVAAYLTILAAMLPLFWAGAGLLRGFALVTVVGMSIGIFITRPAFAAMIETLNKD